MRRLAALLLAGACACAGDRPPPRRILSASEAVSIAAQFARSRGLVVDQTRRARLDRRARWHVDLRGAGGRDRAVVTLDGVSGRVLGARLRGAGGDVPAPPPPPAETPDVVEPSVPEPTGAPPPPPPSPPPPPQG